MKKIVIFNVWWAHSAYCEFDWKKVLIDLGSKWDFSPVNDFLIPLAKLWKFTIWNQECDNWKYLIDQLFLSHLDRDHISDYEKFRENFHPVYMTCPNDNWKQRDDFMLKRELLGNDSDLRNLVLDDMKTRIPSWEDTPLISVIDEISLFYIKPSICENNKELLSWYANNISLVLFFRVWDKTLLIPWDMLKEGMSYLINNDSQFLNLLSMDGVDYLIAPHHWLQTSFSIELFQTIKWNKTRLNIISEKVRESNSNENRSDVDTRYYSSEFSSWINSLNQNAVKTSMWHILIDFEKSETEIKQIVDINEIIKEFI